MRIYLVGLMGSGKTHLGQLLAEAMNYQFIDLDAYVEAKEDASVATIFEQKGEQHFRFAERLALRETYDFKNAIIATGGGTPCFYDNMAWINEVGISVWLKTDRDTLLKRLMPTLQTRPLLQGKNLDELEVFIEKITAERLPFYEQAKIQFNTLPQTSEKEIKALILQISQHK